MPLRIVTFTSFLFSLAEMLFPSAAQAQYYNVSSNNFKCLQENHDRYKPNEFNEVEILLSICPETNFNNKDLGILLGTGVKRAEPESDREYDLYLIFSASEYACLQQWFSDARNNKFSAAARYSIPFDPCSNGVEISQ